MHVFNLCRRNQILRIRFTIYWGCSTFTANFSHITWAKIVSRENEGKVKETAGLQICHTEEKTFVCKIIDFLFRKKKNICDDIYLKFIWRLFEVILAFRYFIWSLETYYMCEVNSSNYNKCNKMCRLISSTEIKWRLAKHLSTLRELNVKGKKWFRAPSQYI